MEFKNCAERIEIKTLSEDGEFEGLGAVFNNVDNDQEIIMPGAFAESLKERPAHKLKILWQHHHDEPIGRYVEAKETERGLFVKGKLTLDVEKAREARALMLDGVVDSLSIGYRTLDEEIDRANDVRKLIKLSLREVSPVTFPANDDAVVTAVKSIGALERLADLEKLLRDDGGFSHSQAKAIIVRAKAIATASDIREDDETGHKLLSSITELTQSLQQRRKVA